MHDPRIGRFFSVDPLTAKYPYYSPYQFSGNRPIDKVELEGLEPANSQANSSSEPTVSGSVSLSYTLGNTFKQNRYNFSATIGATYQMGKHQIVGASLHASLYNGGVGTTQGVTGKTDFQGDFMFSASYTYGTGEGTPTPIKTMNSLNSYSNLNPFKNSATYGLNFIANTDGRNQGNASWGGKFGGNTSIQTYNDVTYQRFFLTKGEDRWWTGGLSVDVDNPNTGNLSGGFDVFTSDRMKSGSRHFEVGTGRRNKNYTVKDARLNNGQTYLQVSNSFGILRVSSIGKVNMISQNAVHYGPGWSFFKSSAQNEFQLTGNLYYDINIGH